MEGERSTRRMGIRSNSIWFRGKQQNSEESTFSRIRKIDKSKEFSCLFDFGRSGTGVNEKGDELRFLGRAPGD